MLLIMRFQQSRYINYKHRHHHHHHHCDHHQQQPATVPWLEAARYLNGKRRWAVYQVCGFMVHATVLRNYVTLF
jgi:hypothetical protein